MAQIELSRRTVLAPTPGATGKPSNKKAVFGQPGDALEVEAIVAGRGGRWYKAALIRDGQQIGNGYVIEAALAGQPGAQKILEG